MVDAFVALAVGFVASGAALLLFSVTEWGMSADKMIGKIAVQAVPGSLGAILAAGQLGLKAQDKEACDRSYPAELAFMLVDELYLTFNLALTDEIVLITVQFTPRHALALTVVSLVVMHAFVYNVEFRG